MEGLIVWEIALGAFLGVSAVLLVRGIVWYVLRKIYLSRARMELRKAMSDMNANLVQYSDSEWPEYDNSSNKNKPH